MVQVGRIDLEEIVDKLSEYKGRHTELITVYIPQGYDVNSAQKQLEAEKSTAKNIKSTATRKNVTDALDKIVRYLKTLKSTPENGLGIFCGNVSEVEGQEDLQLWDIEPPLPVKIRLYRCDKEFVLDPFLGMLEADEIFGLLVMDRKEATIGFLEGKRIEVVWTQTSGIPGKVKAGGQSAQRFHRITEGLTKDFYKKIAEEMKNTFFDNNRVKGIIVGGPVPTKDEFLDNDYLPTQLANKVIGRVDIGDTDESGLKELVTKSQDLLSNQEIVKEQKLLEKFFETLGEKPDLAVYKEADVRRALQYGAVNILLLTKKYDKHSSRELKRLAEGISATVETVSTETPEGEQFKNLSGVGAILRFKVQ